MIGKIYEIYSMYTGTGIVMMLFFVGLFYLAFQEKNRSVRTILLYGNIAIVIFIFLPPVYSLFVNYVDTSTYWRLWWILPVGICLAYVGTTLIHKHRIAGFILIFVVLLFGGRFIYSGKGEMQFADNIYQIPGEVVEIVDFLEEYEENTVYAAFPPEMLPYVRQYDVAVRMPYGREMLDENWSGENGFYQLMSELQLDFVNLAKKCEYNYTRYLIVDGNKYYITAPEECGFALIYTVDRYEVYEYTNIDWDKRNEELQEL